MPSRTIEESFAIRKWIETAIAYGKRNPRAIREFIAENTDLNPPPSIPTIGSIMRELGYAPAGKDWKKGK